MRRLVAVITKRSSKSDAGHSNDPNDTKKPQQPSKSRSGFFRTLSRKVAPRSSEAPPPNADSRSKRHPIPPVSTQPIQAPSSSSSSSGGPHTPDDDASSFLRTALYNQKRTEPWFPPSPPAAENPAFSRSPTHAPSSFLAPPVLPPLRLSQDDTEDESSDAESEDSDAPPPKRPSSILTPLASKAPVELLTPIAFFRALSTNALQPPFSPPPLLDLPNLPIFPRSCNPSRSLVPNESLRSLMFKKRLLRRAQATLSRPDQLTLAAYGPHRPAPPKRPTLHLDDTALKDYNSVGLPSQGLKLWVNRPCFEDRMAVFFSEHDTGVVKPMRVSGSGYGVAALEYTESLEILAGLYDPQDDVRPTLVASPTPISPVSLSPSGSLHSSTPPSPSTTSPPPSQPIHPSSSTKSPSQPPTTASSPTRPQSYKTAAPSPLRMETSSHVPTRSILASSSVQTSNSAQTPYSGAPNTSVSTPTIVLSPTSPDRPSRPLSHPPVTKPGVRFAEEDKDDQIPLGYVLRIKQKREEKARFLQAERQRRVHEEERRKHEEERKTQEEEKKKWDAERAVWDRERKAMEEERKKRKYAEEVAASRSRRESQRFGSLPSKHGVDQDGNVMLWEGDRDRDRERRGRETRATYSRPAYDNAGGSLPRRQGSEPMVGLAASGSRNGSPGSSRPPSVGGTNSAGGSVRGSSKPASMYSTPPSSTQDINSRERRESKASRRTSNITEAPQRSLMGFEQVAYMGGYPWNMNMNMNMGAPPVPVMPVVPIMPYMMDMPLLPPNPPFMLQQFGRPQSQNRSHSSSPSPGHRIPTSQSLERVNVNRQGASSPRHERRASGDVSQARSQRPSPETRSQSYDRQSINSGASRHSSRTQLTQPNSGHPSSNPNVVRGSRSNGSRTSIVGSIPGQQHPTTPIVPVPVMTSSWSQPAFQNLSRPSSSRRQPTFS